jgi:hypothetical protein
MLPIATEPKPAGWPLTAAQFQPLPAVPTEAAWPTRRERIVYTPEDCAQLSCAPVRFQPLYVGLGIKRVDTGFGRTRTLAAPHNQ